jgi:hypothetical protein
MTLKLTPIKHPVVEEFLQSIVRLNVNHIICGVGGSDNYYQKSCCEDVVFATNQNHKIVGDALYRSSKFMPTDGTPKCIYAKRKVESFLAQGKVCS